MRIQPRLSGAHFILPNRWAIRAYYGRTEETITDLADFVQHFATTVTFFIGFIPSPNMISSTIAPSQNGNITTIDSILPAQVRYAGRVLDAFRDNPNTMSSDNKNNTSNSGIQSKTLAAAAAAAAETSKSNGAASNPGSHQNKVPPRFIWVANTGQAVEYLLALSAAIIPSKQELRAKYFHRQANRWKDHEQHCATGLRKLGQRLGLAHGEADLVIRILGPTLHSVLRASKDDWTGVPLSEASRHKLLAFFEVRVDDENTTKISASVSKLQNNGSSVGSITSYGVPSPVMAYHSRQGITQLSAPRSLPHANHEPWEEQLDHIDNHHRHKVNSASNSIFVDDHYSPNYRDRRGSPPFLELPVPHGIPLPPQPGYFNGNRGQMPSIPQNDPWAIQHHHSAELPRRGPSYPTYSSAYDPRCLQHPSRAIPTPLHNYEVADTNGNRYPHQVDRMNPPNMDWSAPMSKPIQHEKDPDYSHPTSGNRPYHGNQGGHPQLYLNGNVFDRQMPTPSRPAVSSYNQQRHWGQALQPSQQTYESVVWDQQQQQPYHDPRAIADGQQYPNRNTMEYLSRGQTAQHATTGRNFYPLDEFRRFE